MQPDLSIPTFSLNGLIHSYFALEPFVVFGFPLLLVLVLALGWQAHRRSKIDARIEELEAAKRALRERLAADLRRSERIFRSIKGDGPKAA